MTTKAERAELRKELGRVGREALLQTLLEAWDQLDALDDCMAVESSIAMHAPFGPCLCGETHNDLVEADG